MKMVKKILIALMLICLMVGIFLAPIKCTITTEKPAITTQFPNRIQEVLPNTVHIMCDKWQGSGVALTEDIVVTARHVVDGRNYTITLNDGTEVKGIQAISHKDYDVGFIKVDRPVLKPAKFGSIKDCVLGQPVFIVGSPLGNRHFNSVSLGIISNLHLVLESYGCSESMGWSLLWMTDSASYGGNSGSPVFSMDGTVRGILVGGYGEYESISYCIPSDLFLGDIENIKMMFAFDKYKVESESAVVEMYNASNQ